MNKAQIYQAIDAPTTIDESVIGQIEEVLANFPTFEIGWMLLLKAMHSCGNLNYNNTLRKGAVHITSRTALFDLIHKQNPETTTVEEAPESANIININNNDIPSPQDDYFASIGETLDEDESAAIDEVIFDAPQQTVYSLDEEEDKVRNATSNMTSGSFTEWLDYVNVQNTPPTDESSARQHNLDLIEKFISNKNSHQFTADESVPMPAETLAANEDQEEQAADQTAFLTETLANIYVNQNKIDKAINILRKLMLKNPDKSAYFAARIAELNRKLNDK